VKIILYWIRIGALLIDFLLIALYATCLFGVVYFFTDDKPLVFSPYMGQLVAFLSLTLPVLLYLICFEYSSKQASLGKQICKLQVRSINGGKASLQSIIIRNVIKLLPWEVAHAFVQALFYFINKNEEPPVWVWIGLIIPQLAAFVYFITPVLNEKGKGINDLIANTIVVRATSRS
jgi:uncharacterized RDD family membrane protein YckC